MAKDTIKEDLGKLLKKHFLQPISVQIADEMKNIERIVTHVQSFQASKKKSTSYKDIAKYAEEFHAIVDQTWETPEEKSFSDTYSGLVSALNTVFEKLVESEIQEQSRDRFYALPSDSQILKLRKWGKRIAYKTSKIFNKKKQFWDHSIPLRGLAQSHFYSQLVLDLRDLTDVFYKTFCAQYLRIKEAEESLSEEGITISDEVLNDIKVQLSNLIKVIEQEVGEVLETRYAAYLADQEIVDTIELSANKFTTEAVQKSIKRSEENWARNRKNWSNTIYALFEEWRSDLDIFHLKNLTLAELDAFQAAQIKKLGAQIDPEIEAILTTIEGANKTLSKKLVKPRAELEVVGIDVQKRLGTELVPKLCEKLTSQKITNLINKLESNIHKSVENLSDEHVRVKTSTFDSPLADDELKKVSLYELISFETLETFQEDFEGIKKGLFKALEEATTYSSDLPQIVSFSISSAISALEEGKEEKEAISIATDGLARAITRMTNTREQLEVAISENSEQLHAVVQKFCDAIMELTYKENVGELRLRITKAKAAKQAEEVKEQLREKIQNRKKMVLELGSTLYKKGEDFLDRIGKKFILTAGKPALSREASDFLLSSQHAIDSLPLIYRRLYRIEPLEDLELFEGREEEVQKLSTAFENWNKGRYAATAVVGEKWGGLTTFMNYAIANAKYPYSLTRFAPKDNISTEAGFIELMKTIFENETFENLDQVVAYLNNGKKRVVVLEDLQNLYLKRVGGFVALQLLFQLITRTYKNVFWITTTTIYTWKYLEKAININEYFSYSIELGELTKDQIVNIIWKRNRISGYSISFEASESLMKDKKFLKLSTVDQQQFLKDEYFSELNSFAKSNVSLALIFWLLSTKKIDQSVITIGEFHKPDLDFLSVMAMEKVYTMHALILHDGLSEYQLSQVLNITESTSRLNLLALLEDGIIMKNNSTYLVNPVVYRNAISVLKAKNLIH